jgi:hypothetical protein
MSKEDCENCEYGQMLRDRIIAINYQARIDARDELISLVKDYSGYFPFNYDNRFSYEIKAIEDADKQ